MSGHLWGRKTQSLSAKCREVCASPDESERMKQMFFVVR